ncbi:MAG: polysaccharide biosynthesis tyrosine autokinase [Hyphomicrobiales bacterium]
MMHHREALDWHRDGHAAPDRGASSVPMAPAGRTDLRGLFRILRSRFLFIAVTTALFVAMAFAYIALAKPQYSSSASILIDPRRRQVVNSEVVPSGLGTDMAVVQNLVQSQLEIIRSETVLSRVVESENLAVDPEFIGDGSVDPLTAVRMAIGGLLSMGSAPASSSGPSDPTGAALRALGERVKVKRAAQTYVLEVSVTAATPEKAARLTQAVAEAYINDQRQVKADASRQANSWLTARLDELRDRMLEAEKAVADYKAANGILSIEGGFISEKQVARINEQLVAIRAQSAEAEAKYEQARRLLQSGVGLDTIGGAIGSETILKLRQQYADIARQESEQAMLLGPRHPKLKATRAQLNSTRGLIKAELERIAAAAKAEFEVIRSREIALEKSAEAAQRDAKENSQAEVRLRELTSEAETSRSVYTEFLSRAKETGEQDGLDSVEARIISPAAVPDRPVSPRKMIALALALTAGVGIGIGGALMREHFSEEAARMRRRSTRAATPAATPAAAPARNPASASARAGARVGAAWAAVTRSRRDDSERDDREAASTGGALQPLAALPALDPAQRGPLAAFAEIANRPSGAFAAAFEGLRRQLDAPFPAGSPRITLVASARPGDGRSTVAAGLAMSAALNGEHVLLVDGDARHAGLARAINPHAAAGLADVAEGEVAFEDIAVHDPESGLVFAPLAAGEPVDWQRGLAAVRALAREAAGYDRVIVDSAPVLTDASVQLLADIADEAVLVTRDGAAAGRDIDDALFALRLPAGRLRGIVTVPAARAA